MELKFKQINKLDFEIEGKLKYDEFKNRYEAELEEFSKRSKISGFRPGKAPREIIERRYGEEIKSRAVRSKIIDILTEETRKKERWLEISELKNLVWVEDGDGVTFTVKVEVIPKVNIDLSNIELKKDVKIEVSDDEVKREIELRRQRNAILEDSEKDKLDGEADEVGVFDIYIKDITNQRNIDRGLDRVIDISASENWFKNAVIGMKKGEKREVVVNGNRKVSIILKDIKKKVLPSDEDLAKTLGYSSEAEMIEDLKKKIYESKKAILRDELYFEAINQIFTKNNMQVPVSLVQRYFSDIVSSNSQISEEDAKKLAVVRAVEYVILLNIIESQKIEVSDKEIEDYVVKNFGPIQKDQIIQRRKQDLIDLLKFQKAREKILELIKI